MTVRNWALEGVTSINLAREENGFKYGQFCQDFFVNKLLNTDGGFFLDIGAGIGDYSTDGPFGVPISTMSNTYGLEKHRKWHGIAIDYDKKYIEEAKKARSCNLLCVDLIKNNINELLEQCNCPEKMDYLSFDIDDAQEKVFNEFDFSKYKFQIITYEHNLFRGCDKQQRISRNRFKKLGYKLLFGNVGRTADEPVEDWYVDSKLFEKHKHLADENIPCGEIAQTLRKNTS